MIDGMVIKEFGFGAPGGDGTRRCGAGSAELLLLLAAKMGAPLVYRALLLHYVLQRPDLPPRVRAAVVDAFGCLARPFGIVRGTSPAVGRTDAAAAFLAALASASMYVDAEVREKARGTMLRYFSAEVVADL